MHYNQLYYHCLLSGYNLQGGTMYQNSRDGWLCCCGSREPIAEMDKIRDNVSPTIQQIPEVQHGMRLLAKMQTVTPPDHKPENVICKVAFNYDNTFVFPLDQEVPNDTIQAAHGHSAGKIVPYLADNGQFCVTCLVSTQNDGSLASATMMDPFALMLTCWILTYQGYPCVIGSDKLFEQPQAAKNTKFQDMCEFICNTFGDNSFFFKNDETIKAQQSLSKNSTTNATHEMRVSSILNYWRGNPGYISPMLVDSTTHFTDVRKTTTGTGELSKQIIVVEKGASFYKNVLSGVFRTAYDAYVDQALKAFVQKKPQHEN